MKLSMITTGLAALVLAGCGDNSHQKYDFGEDAARPPQKKAAPAAAPRAPFKPADSQKTVAYFPEDCDRVINITRRDSGWVTLTYQATNGDFRLREFKFPQSYDNISFAKAPPKTDVAHQAILPSDCSTPVSVTKIQPEHYLLTYKAMDGTLRSQDITVRPDEGNIKWVPAEKPLEQKVTQ